MFILIWLFVLTLSFQVAELMFIFLFFLNFSFFLDYDLNPLHGLCVSIIECDLKLSVGVRYNQVVHAGS